MVCVVVRCVLFVVHCLLCFVFVSFVFVCCLLFVVCCSRSVVRGPLFVVCRSLLVDGWLLLFVYVFCFFGV